MPARFFGTLFALYVSLPLSAQPQLAVHGAWVRALPPTQSSTAAYLTLHNQGDTAYTVVSGSSPIAESVEIHTTREIDGMLRMQQLPQLTVAPASTSELRPGGTHLMLLGLARMPAAGEEVTLCLKLASGDEVCTVAPVRKGGAGDGAGAHHHH